MKAKLLLYGGIAVFIILGYVVFQYIYSEVIPSKASILISANSKSKVFIDDKQVGETTYQNQSIKSGEHKIRLLSDDDRSWETKIKLDPDTQVLINRDLGVVPQLGSGEILTLEKGEGILISTNPLEAKVTIDDNDQGSSPVDLVLTPGQHKISVSKENYLTRMLEVSITNGTRIYLDVDLSPIVKTDYKNLDKYKNLSVVHIFSPESGVVSDLSLIAPSIKLEDFGIDFLIDEDGELLTNKETAMAVIKEKVGPVVGYLAHKDATALSDAAKKALDELLASVPNPIQMIEVTSTPTGFLNVREKASTGSKQVGRINPGEKYELLEEQTGWVKIKLTDGTEGWVSSRYVKKV